MARCASYGFKSPDTGLRILGFQLLGYRVSGLSLGLHVSKLWHSDLGSRVQDFGSRVLRVQLDLNLSFRGRFRA